MEVTLPSFGKNSPEISEVKELFSYYYRKKHSARWRHSLSAAILLHTEPTGSYIPSSIASSRSPGRGRPRRPGRPAAGAVIVVAVSTAMIRTIEPLCSQARQVPHDQDYSAKDSLHRKTQKSQSADRPEVYSQNKLHMEKNMEKRHIRSDITQKTN